MVILERSFGLALWHSYVRATHWYTFEELDSWNPDSQFLHIC